MPLQHPERIHPTLWRASQLALGRARRLASGHPALDQALGGGWRPGTLTELLPDRPGIGEIRLILPALAGLADRRQPIMLINPPYAPSMQCWAAWGLRTDDLIWIRARSAQDTLWAAAQVLHYQSSAALLCWLDAAPYASLLSLHRLANRAATLTFLYRPAHAARHDSPAGLRIGLQAIPRGLKALFLKSPGALPAPLDLTLHPYDHALDQPAAATAAGGLSWTAGSPAALHPVPGHA